MLTSDIRNKLNIGTSHSFVHVQNVDELPLKRFDRVLYFLQEEDNEEMVIKNLMKVCTPKGLILISGNSEINKRLSNGILKRNKDVFAHLMDNNCIERFWFFDTMSGQTFDFLMEIK